MADQIAKEAATGKHGHGHFLNETDDKELIDKTVIKNMQSHAPESEKQMWTMKGAALN